MMLPAVAPMLLIYAGVMRSSPEGPRAALRVYPMAAGYLLVWIAFSLIATVAQRALGATVITPMMTLQSSVAAAALLAVAALYQLTPLKRVCLDSCRSPIAFILERMRPSAAGAFRLRDLKNRRERDGPSTRTLGLQRIARTSGRRPVTPRTRLPSM